VTVVHKKPEAAPAATASRGPAARRTASLGTLDDYMALWWHGEARLPEDQLITWLQHQRLLPLLGWRAEVKGWSLPATIDSAIRQRRLRIAIGQTLVDQQLKALGATAQELGIPVVLVKGAAAGMAYPEPWMRPFGDIDLLTGESDTQRLFETLVAQGYTQAAGTEGMRAWHLPPLGPPRHGAGVEIHPALAQEQGRWLFTIEQWRERLQPLKDYPGLLAPAVVDHALYITHHAVIHHEFGMGLQALADTKFLTQDWEAAVWDMLADEATAAGMTRAVGLLFSLTAWFWDEPDCEGAQRFPAPPGTVLSATKEIMGGTQIQQRMPHLWRDTPSYDLRGILTYARTILLGDTGQLKELPMKGRVKYHLHRPAELWRNHSASLWQLIRGTPDAKASWRTQRELQTWLRGGEER